MIDRTRKTVARRDLLSIMESEPRDTRETQENPERREPRTPDARTPDARSADNVQVLYLSGSADVTGWVGGLGDRAALAAS